MNQNIPLYQKIFNEIEKKILDGEYLEGDLLPSEKELQNKYDVSRITVRRAMEMLQNEGYVEKFSGLGTIVKSARRVIKLRSTSGFSKDNRRFDATSKLIEFEVIIPSPKIQAFLNLNSNESVYKITRLRLINNEIVGLHTSFVPEKIITLNRDLFKNGYASLYSLFDANDIKIGSADETIEVRSGNDTINELLNVHSEFSSLYIERTTFNEIDKPIEFVEIYYRTDRYKYQTKFHNYIR